jgi:hypothetical protein
MNEPNPDAVKAAADAELAKITAEQKKREAEEWNSALAQRRRVAEHESAIAKAGKDVVDARQSPWTTLASGLASGLADAPRGTTTVSGDQPIMGSALALKGLGVAAGKVAGVVRDKAAGARSILVTSDVDLATVDAAHHEVAACLHELRAAADRYLAPEEPVVGAESLGAAAAAVAALIPSVVGMMAAQHTVSSFAITADDLAATAAVVGALLDTVPDVDVAHNDFRMRTESAVDSELTGLRERRWRLAELEIPAEAVAEKERVMALIAAIDAFDSAVRAVPAGAKRSPLTNAALYEELHKDDGIDHVLLVKGLSGSGSQVVADRPLWFKDRFFVTTTVNITYLLLAAGKSNRIVHGGTESATVTLRGRIGDKLEPENE